MGIFSFLNPALDFIFGPLLRLPAFWALLILSLIIALLTTFVYKYTTNQRLMKQLKGEIKELQAQVKNLRHDPEAAMAVQKKMMETNTKYMMQGMRSTLFTILPLILVFGWLQAHLAFMPILPGQEFALTVNLEDGFSGAVSIDAPDGMTVTSDANKTVSDHKAVFTLRGREGEHAITVNAGNGAGRTVGVLITNETKYNDPLVSVKDGAVESVVIGNEKRVVMDLFGWKIGWLGTYIIFSIILSMSIRKLMKVY